MINFLRPHLSLKWPVYTCNRTQLAEYELNITPMIRGEAPNCSTYTGRTGISMDIPNMDKNPINPKKINKIRLFPVNIDPQYCLGIFVT